MRVPAGCVRAAGTRVTRARSRQSAAAPTATAKAPAGPYASARRPQTTSAVACPATRQLAAKAIEVESRAGSTDRSVSANAVIRCGA